jgi:FkbM family methyltransferase
MGVRMMVHTLNRVSRAVRRYAVTGRLRADPGPIIERFFSGKNCFFVQVGSNDGVRGDPLHAAIKRNPQWRGIFIEPLDEAFEKLITNYPADSRYSFENVAIAETDGERWFYYVPDSVIEQMQLPRFPGAGLHGASSFDYEHVLKNVIGLETHGVTLKRPPESYISKKVVRCNTLVSVLARNSVASIDLFHVDAEGADYEIIRQLDFEKFSPKIILFEGARNNAGIVAFLSEKGCRLIKCGDTMAIKPGWAFP